MEELTAGVRALHDRVEKLDDLLHEHRDTADLREKLGAAAMRHADNTRALLRRVAILLAAGLLIWTPVVAYAAVWAHEKVRNNCYPVLWLEEPASSHVHEPWYCGLFPGTDHKE